MNELVITTTPALDSRTVTYTEVPKGKRTQHEDEEEVEDGAEHGANEVAGVAVAGHAHSPAVVIQVSVRVELHSQDTTHQARQHDTKPVTIRQTLRLTTHTNITSYQTTVLSPIR